MLTLEKEIGIVDGHHDDLETIHLGNIYIGQCYIVILDTGRDSKIEHPFTHQLRLYGLLDV